MCKHFADEKNYGAFPNWSIDDNWHRSIEGLISTLTLSELVAYGIPATVPHLPMGIKRQRRKHSRHTPTPMGATVSDRGARHSLYVPDLPWVVTTMESC
jgi:hypothetical protein